jgi:hypothetical protein
LEAFDDICANGLVDCHGLASTKIKPFIDAILSDRQAAETAFYYRTANIVAGGSLFISFIALIFAGLTYFRRTLVKEDSRLTVHPGISSTERHSSFRQERTMATSRKVVAWILTTPDLLDFLIGVEIA